MHHYDLIRDMEVSRRPRQRQVRVPLVMGIDPGSEQSAYAVVRDDYGIERAEKVENAQLLAELGAFRGRVVIESLQSYGMPVGRSVFETAYQIGKILRQCEIEGLPADLIPRPEYGRALCGGHKVTDAILRQALLLRFGADTKGGPLALLKGNSDKRSAYAVAVYSLDCQ